MISSEYVLNRVSQNSNSSNVNSAAGTAANQTLNTMSFEQVYNRIANQGVNLSKHAYNRIKTRNIEFSESQFKQLSKAMEQAKQKGIKDALIMFDNKMIIANVKNNTIVTIANKSDLNEDIITNIDGAILL